MSTSSTTHIRNEFGPSTCTVLSYSSSGGIILKNCTGVGLDHLGLPRTKKGFSREDPMEEDTFVLRLLQLGARWWPSLKFYNSHPDSDMPVPYGHHYPPDLNVGSPSMGGVCVLKTFSKKVFTRLETDAPERPEDRSRLWLSRTMDERCDALKEFGSEWFERLDVCAQLPKTLEEGAAEGKRYEQLIRKMQDHVYLDNWLLSVNV